MFMAGVEDTEEVFTFVTKTGNKLPNMWKLLNNQSTVNVFYNKQVLKDRHSQDWQWDHCTLQCRNHKDQCGGNAARTFWQEAVPCEWNSQHVQCHRSKSISE